VRTVVSTLSSSAARAANDAPAAAICRRSADERYVNAARCRASRRAPKITA
jgi:hypothetical protein